MELSKHDGINTIGYIGYVVKRNVFKHSFFEAYSFRTHTFPHHLSVKVWAWIAKMVVWCSEPKEAQRSIACSQHQKQETKMKFAAVGTLCGNMQNRCRFCLPSVQDNVTMRTNCKCLTPECIVITPECNEMALIYIYYIYKSNTVFKSSSAALPRSDDQRLLPQALPRTWVSFPRAQLSFIPK